jgi:hypothetical protein
MNLQQINKCHNASNDEALIEDAEPAQVRNANRLVGPEPSGQVKDAAPDYAAITQGTVNRGRIGIPERAIRAFFTPHEGTAAKGALDALCAKTDSHINSEDPLISSLAQDYRLADDLTYIRSMRTNRLRIALQSDTSHLPNTWKGLIGNLKNKSFQNPQASSGQTLVSPDYKSDNGAIADAFNLLNHKNDQLERTAKFWSQNRALVESDQPNPNAVKIALKQHVGAHRKSYQGEQIGIKIGLELAGGVMLPPSEGLAGMFPQRDYVVMDEGLTQLQEFELLTNHANKLVQKYRLLDTDDKQRITQTKLGCICVMFAKEQSADGKKVYVPFFGISKGPASGEANIQKYLHRMGLPEINLRVSPADTQLLDNRYKQLKQHFSDLQSVGLKTPSKQAMISYMQFIDDQFKTEITKLVNAVELKNESKLKANFINQETVRLMQEKPENGALTVSSLKKIGQRAERFAKVQMNRAKEEQLVSQGLLDPMTLNLKSIESWNSLQCAEPAAIMTAAQLYYRMADMDVSLPFEGKARIDQDANLDDTSKTEYLAKETCGRCAVSEMSFGGLTSSGLRENIAMAQANVTTGASLANTLHDNLTQNKHGNKLPDGQHHSREGYYDPATKLPAVQRLLKVLDGYEMGQMSKGDAFQSTDSRPQPLPPETEQSGLYNHFWSNKNFLKSFFSHFQGGGG